MSSTPRMVYCKPIWEGRGGGIDEFGVREYTKKWRVRMENASADPLESTATDQLPAVGEVYFDENGAVDWGCTCRKIRSERVAADPFLHIVTAEFSSARIATSPGDDPLANYVKQALSIGTPDDPNPLRRPPRWEYGTVLYQRVQPTYWDSDEFDFIRGVPKKGPDGKPFKPRVFKSSAGQAYQPPPPVDDYRMRLTITRFERIFPLSISIVYTNAVNEDTFLGRPEGTWKCLGIKGRPHYENFIFCAEVTYDFEARAEGWDVRVLDEGTWELDIVDETLVPRAVVDKLTGAIITSPVPLDGNGNVLETDVGSNPDFHFNTFRPYRRLPFSLLRLTGRGRG